MRFAILSAGRPLHRGEFAAALELGRRQSPDEPLFRALTCPTGRRMAIAEMAENSISRRHALLTPLPDARVRIANLTTNNAVVLHDGALGPGESRDVLVPCRLGLGHLQVQIEGEPAAEHELQSLAQPVTIPGGAPTALAPLPPLEEREAELLASWLRAVVDVLQSAASSHDFYERAASAAVEFVGLDAGRVLLYESGAWNVAAEKLPDGPSRRETDWQPSRQILDCLLAEKRTVWRQGAGGSAGGASLAKVEAVVASPILDRRGEVIGALYGDRRSGSRPTSGPRISRADAMLVETLATGVAAGIARLEQEQAALAARVRFEQFFSAELADQLTQHPDLLDGRDAEVTLLFCDICGFSRISERLGPQGTMQWINDVLGVASECVIHRQGVLVDYVGDELLAMWGAPAAQPDHARLACLAAIDIWQSLPELNERWLPKLQEPTKLGIGVNTGVARVGNTGTRRKFKYGPLGNTVNVCSRVQGATKYLKTGIIATSATHDRLDDSLARRRLCQVRVMNIAQPITLFELCPQPSDEWRALAAKYDEALAEFEQQRFSRTTAILGELLEKHPDDGPATVLLSRAAGLLADQLAGRAAAFDPVWELPGK